jgi:hypothetical protein
MRIHFHKCDLIPINDLTTIGYIALEAIIKSVYCYILLVHNSFVPWYSYTNLKHQYTYGIINKPESLVNTHVHN